jgi:hypothetical protein
MAWFDRPLLPWEGTATRTSQGEGLPPDGEAMCHACPAHTVGDDGTAAEGRESNPPDSRGNAVGTRNRQGSVLLAMLRALSAWSM